MKKTSNLTQWDKITSALIILCFIFWVLAKIPKMHDFIPFGILYESGGWLISLLITILLSVYFLIRWIVHKFTFNKIYLYGFLLALATLCIFRFIFSISMEGIKLMPDHIKFI
ncbi:MAG: hypothetical protein KIG55_02115 [Myroides sp.]|nr:hypothetical protein [uncultured Flavobacterium sp.]MBS7320374.1 hypothetical protein [Myroides sp.]